MKVLDAESLNHGIQTALHEITETNSQISAIQRSVRDLVLLEDVLKGKTGESIRTFFNTVHQPFLIFMHQSLTDFEFALKGIQNAIEAYEPSPNGLIRQDFIEHDVRRGLDQSLNATGNLVEQANQAIANVSDIISLPRINMDEFEFRVQTGKNKLNQMVVQLHDLDRSQVNALEPVQQDLTTMKNYLTDIGSKFKNGDLSISDYNMKAIQDIDAHKTIIDSIYNKDSQVEDEGDQLIKEYLNNLDKDDTNHEFSPENYEHPGYGPITFWDKSKVMGGQSKLAGTPDGLAGPASLVGNIGIGIGTGAYNVGKDLVVGTWNLISDPVGTVTSLGHMVLHPIETSKYLKQAISDSYQRDMINGDAESRSRWVTYALGTAVTSVVGTKGAGTVTKTGVATTKAGARNLNKKVTNLNLSELFPSLQNQPAFVGPVPYNVVDGNFLKEQLIVKAEKFSGSGGSTRIYNNKTMDHLFLGEINRRKRAVGYHHESIMGGKIVPGTKTAPDKNGVYRAKVTIDGKEKHIPSSFFPQHWNRVEVLKAVREAYGSKKHLGRGLYQGTTSSGMRIRMYLNKDGKTIATAFPVYEK